MRHIRITYIASIAVSEEEYKYFKNNEKSLEKLRKEINDMVFCEDGRTEISSIYLEEVQGSQNL